MLQINSLDNSKPVSYDLIKEAIYFTDQYPNEIPYQSDFCEYINSNRSSNPIESPNINPMTVRLCSALKELEFIDGEYDKFACLSELDNIVTEATISKSSYTMSIETGSRVVTPEFTSDNRFDPPGWEYAGLSSTGFVYRSTSDGIALFELHRSLYNYLFHISSILDRVKHEFDIFYHINPRGSRRIYLLDLLDNPNNYSLDVSDGSEVINRLTSLVHRGCYIRRAHKYRNTVAHQGYININDDIANRKIYIQDDPDLSPSFDNEIDLLEFVTAVFSEIKIFVNKFYELLLTDATNNII